MSSALTEPSKFKSWYRKNDIAITPWLFLLPAVLFFATYVIVPIGQSFWISFHMWDGLGEKTFVGMDNYERLLGLGDQKMDRKFELVLEQHQMAVVIPSCHSNGVVHCIIFEPNCDGHPPL